MNLPKRLWIFWKTAGKLFKATGHCKRMAAEIAQLRIQMAEHDSRATRAESRLQSMKERLPT